MAASRVNFNFTFHCGLECVQIYLHKHTDKFTSVCIQIMYLRSRSEKFHIKDGNVLDRLKISAARRKSHMGLNLVTKVCFLCASSMVAVVAKYTVCDKCAEQKKSSMVSTITIWPFHGSRGSRTSIQGQSMSNLWSTKKHCIDFSLVFRFSPVSIIRQCPILTVIYMLLLP
jgi:hypothetical protein